MTCSDRFDKETLPQDELTIAAIKQTPLSDSVFDCINAYYIYLSPEDLEKARELSEAIFEKDFSLQLVAAVEICDFVPNMPHWIINHIIKRGLEDPYDMSFMESALIFYRVLHLREQDGTATAEEIKAAEKSLGRRLVSALSFADWEPEGVEIPLRV